MMNYSIFIGSYISNPFSLVNTLHYPSNQMIRETTPLPFSWDRFFCAITIIYPYLKKKKYFSVKTLKTFKEFHSIILQNNPSFLKFLLKFFFIKIGVLM